MAEFLVFSLGREEFGIGIRKVREIRMYGNVTALPCSRAFLKGFINLRGGIVPVVDLRVRFGYPDARCDAATVLVVIEVAERVLAIAVDAVSDVARFAEDEVRPPPDMDGLAAGRFLAGVALAGERVVMLLDLDQALSPEELAMVDGIDREAVGAA